MARKSSSGFARRTIKSWPDFTSALSHQNDRWIYRGQRQDWPLATSLERSLSNWDIDLREALKIEHQFIRDFRRQYRGEYHLRVNNDTLDCLALMQHHGAPTRLIDWTYSPFIAAKFAIDGGAKHGVVWSLNVRWCNEAVSKITDERTVRKRDVDTARNDTTFIPIYMEEQNKKKFVYPENPFHLNERLIIQQGVFLCAGDATAPLVDNLMALDDWRSTESIVQFDFDLDPGAVREFARMLTRMNVDSAVLFPGLDGFARSIGERLFLYEGLAQRRVGQSDHVRP